MSDSIELLQKQLATLQAQSVISSPASPVVSMSIEDLKQVVKAVIAEEVTLLKQEGIPIKPVENMSLLQSIGLGLTEEEQIWLSASDKLQGVEKHLPLFFQTEDGKLAVQSFILYYRGVYDCKT